MITKDRVFIGKERKERTERMTRKREGEKKEK